MALHLNLNRDPKSQPEPFKATDFMNFLEKEPERKLTPEEIEQQLDRMFGT